MQQVAGPGSPEETNITDCVMFFLYWLFIRSSFTRPTGPSTPAHQGPALSEDVSAASSSSSSVEISGLLSDAKTAGRWPNPTLSSDEVETTGSREDE